MNWQKGWKFLAPDLGTHSEYGDFYYIAPRSDQEWSDWTLHPEPGQIDGEDCGPGALHVMLSLNTCFAPDNWWPWRARWLSKDELGRSNEKARTIRLQLKRISPLTWWRYLRRFGRGTNLVGADLMGANLTGANLTGANLTEADLARANLAGADLVGANLVRANLTEADLMGADLARADLAGADLVRACLVGADLMGAYLARADLMGANLTGADLTEADLTEANLTEANLVWVDLTEADLTGANQWETNLARANLVEKQMVGRKRSYWVYFVAYETIQGPANREIYLDSPITSMEAIREIEKEISMIVERGRADVVITNFIELRLHEETDYDD